MPAPADLLRRIRENTDLAAFLAEFPEFDINRHEPRDEPRLTSGTPLHAIAGDFTGGMFYLCGDEPPTQPVLYASSEGEAGVIAPSLPDALDILIGLPYWRDCLTYSADGDLDTMQSAAALLQQDLSQDRPEADAAQAHAAELIGSARRTITELVQRLHAAVSGAGPEFVFTDATGEYGGLFGPFEPSRNSRWDGRL